MKRKPLLLTTADRDTIAELLRVARSQLLTLADAPIIAYQPTTAPAMRHELRQHAATAERYIERLEGTK